jgi:DNA-binding transcriptional regulator YhcF (GntR family)
MRNKNSIKHISDATLTMRFNQLNDYLHQLGYTNKEIIKMLKSEPSLYNYSVETLKQKIDDMMSLGYTKKALIKMIKSYPTLCTLSKATINQKNENMMSLGYTKEEVMKITSMYSPLFSLNIDSMRQKIIDIMSLGYTKEEVIEMTKALPSLYGLNIENIRQKVEFYDEIDIHQYAVSNPTNFIQGVALSYAKYNFYLSRGINITINNCRKLFINCSEFKRSYGISKEELLEKYNYSEHLEENKILGDTITNMEVFDSILGKRVNFVLECIKAEGRNKIDSMNDQKEMEKIMMKRIFR